LKRAPDHDPFIAVTSAATSHHLLRGRAGSSPPDARKTARARTGRTIGAMAPGRPVSPSLNERTAMIGGGVEPGLRMTERENRKKEASMTDKLKSGERLPDVTVPQLGGGAMRLGAPVGGHDWSMVVVYRGKHCPICKTYLGELERLAPEFAKAGVGVVAVSGDPEDRARSFTDDIGVTFPVGYDLTVAQMRMLGLYVSEPRSEKETDRPFAEPGVFVINAEGMLHVVDISNAPFSRPDLAGLAKGLKYIRDNDYPIRGRLAA